MYSFWGYIGIWCFCRIPMYLEYMVFRTYIGNARFRACPMYYCTSFSRRYIGIEFSMPIPMYGGPNLSKIYIGMGQYRLFPMYRLKSQEQNTSEFSNSYQSRCIKILHTSKTQVFFKSRCISINFPRLYPLSLTAYSRASRQKQTKYIGIRQFIPIPMHFN